VQIVDKWFICWGKEGEIKRPSIGDGVAGGLQEGRFSTREKGMSKQKDVRSHSMLEASIYCYTKDIYRSRIHNSFCSSQRI